MSGAAQGKSFRGKYVRFRQQWEVAKLKALLADGLGPCERRLALAIRTAYNAALVRAYRCALTLI